MRCSNEWWIYSKDRWILNWAIHLSHPEVSGYLTRLRSSLWSRVGEGWLRIGLVLIWRDWSCWYWGIWLIFFVKRPRFWLSVKVFRGCLCNQGSGRQSWLGRVHFKTTSKTLSFNKTIIIYTTKISSNCSICVPKQVGSKLIHRGKMK